jgi:tRNA G18 (ribose-2'-O)-methylase SpoU
VVRSPERITGPRDSRLDDYRDIANADRLEARGLFVAEGRLVVRRAIETNGAAVRSVLVNDAARRSLEPWLALLPAHVPILVCDTADFLEITGYNLHRGCLALAERPPTLSVGDVLERACADVSRSRITIVVLEGVANADNVGGVFRNAAAFGAAGILLDAATADPWYRKAIRTSMAAVLCVPFARLESWHVGVDALRNAGFQIVALTPREPAITVGDFAQSRSARVALLVGSEGEGLTVAAERAADYRIKIPIEAGVDSLNLAVAVGIALHRLTPPPSSLA